MSFLAHHSTQPLEIKEIKLLQDCKEDLASHMPYNKLVKLSEDLRRKLVISKKVNDIFASLDHARLDSQLSVRYILQHVCDGVKHDVGVFHQFVKALARHGESAERVSKCLHEQSCVSDRGEGRESQPPSHETEGSQAVSDDIYLSEDHLRALMNILAGVTHKWEILGIALGLTNAVIEDCRSGSYNTLRLYNILCKWVRGMYENAVPATINNLKRVLASQLVDEAAVAQQLEEKFREPYLPLLESQPSPSPSPRDPTLIIDCLSTDTEVSDGKSTLLEVHVCFNDTVSYHWMKDGEYLSDGLVFFGTSSDILAISPASQGIEGIYTCRINEEVITDEILLTVIFPPEKKRLITLYSRRREIISDSWPPGGTKTFINLALVKKDKEGTDNYSYSIRGDEDDIREGKEKIEYKEVFGRYTSGALVLVEGRPGSGKTTLVHKVTRDWAKRGNVLENAKLVFLISLRSLSRGKDESLSDILKPFYAVQELFEKFEKLVHDIIASHGKGVCFIIDGLDEYHRRDESDSVIYQLLHQRENYLAEAMVIVASRPVATGKLRREPQVSIRVEVLWFSKQEIFDYIQEYTFSSDLLKSDASPAELKAYLNSHLNVLHMCYAPLHVEMICYLYEHVRGDIPRTETEIYELFTKLIVLRTLKRSNENIRLHSLDNLPGEEKEHFRKICHLALEMTVQSQQVVQQDHTKVPLCLGASPDDAPFLGLVTIDRTAGLEGFDNTYAFLHLTLQEFLAAFYLAKLTEEKDHMSMIIVYAKHEHMLMVWKFFFGMVKFQDEVIQNKPPIQYIARQTHIGPTNDDKLFEVQCAFESQERRVCSSIVRERNGILNLCTCTLTPADLTAVGYVISNTSHYVTELLMKVCHLHDDKVRTLFSEVPPSKLKYILTLDLEYNQIGYVGAAALAKALKDCNNLQTLYLSHNNIGDDGAGALVGGLKSCNNLQTLFLSHNIIGAVGAEALSKALCCNNLQKLDLSFNNIGVDGATALAHGLTSCNNLQELSLISTNIRDNGAAALASVLKSCNNLQALLLDCNNIGDCGAEALAGKLKSCKNLHFLSLSRNNIGDDGAAALADGLKSCNDLRVLMLASNNIGDKGAAALGDGLKSCNDLQELILSSNNIGDHGAVALVDGLKACNDLRTLEICNNNIGSHGSAALCDLRCHQIPEDYFFIAEDYF